MNINLALHEQIDNIVRRFGLRAGVAIQARARTFGIVDHYIVYLGTARNGQHLFIGNLGDSVQWVGYDQLYSLLQKYRVTNFEVCNDSMRCASPAETVKRAQRLVGREYSFWNYNCEHFKNHVLYGRAYSQQIENVRDIGKGALIGVIGFGLLYSAVSIAKSFKGSR